MPCHQLPSLFITNLATMSHIIALYNIKKCTLRNWAVLNSLKDFHIIGQFRDGCNVTLGMKRKNRDISRDLVEKFV